MNRTSLKVVLAVFLLLGALVAFTDLEIGLVKWVSCGPFSTQSEDRSELCRK